MPPNTGELAALLRNNQPFCNKPSRLVQGAGGRLVYAICSFLPEGKRATKCKLFRKETLIFH